MDRRRFLVLSTCAAGAALLPLDLANARPVPPSGLLSTGRTCRILYGRAGRACAQLPGSPVHSQSLSHGAGFLDDTAPFSL